MSESDYLGEGANEVLIHNKDEKIEILTSSSANRYIRASMPSVDWSSSWKASRSVDASIGIRVNYTSAV